MKKNLLFIGNPGAGKGTQAGMLVKEFGFISISTGDLYRNELARESKWSEYFRELQKNSQLVDDETMNRFLSENEEFLNSLHSGKFLFDGYPRTVGQAEFLKRILEKEKIRIDRIFYLEVSQEECSKRLADRFVCSTCKACFNSAVAELAPRKVSTCDLCGGKLATRFDDSSPEQIKKRMIEYDLKTSPLVDFYRDELIRIDASRSPSEVYQEIRNHLVP